MSLSPERSLSPEDLDFIIYKTFVTPIISRLNLQ